MENKKLITDINMNKECSYRPAIKNYKDVKPKVYEAPSKPEEKPKSVGPKQKEENQRILNAFLERMEKYDKEKKERELIAEQIRKNKEEELYHSVDIKANLRNNIVRSSANEKAIRKTIKNKNYAKKPLYRNNEDQGRESGSSFKTVNMMDKNAARQPDLNASRTYELKLDEFVSLNFIVKPWNKISVYTICIMYSFSQNKSIDN